MRRIHRSAVVAMALAAASGTAYVQTLHGQAGNTGTTQRPSTARPAPPPSGQLDSRAFIEQMTIAGLAEVELGKMALERAADPEVKAFGQMMVKDHSDANKQLAQVAAELNVRPPLQMDQKHRALADRLATLRGAEFDREYMKAMVQGHEDVLSHLRTRVGNQITADTTADGNSAVGTAGRDPNDLALTQWGMMVLPTAQGHLDRARELQQKHK